MNSLRYTFLTTSEASAKVDIKFCIKIHPSLFGKAKLIY